MLLPVVHFFLEIDQSKFSLFSFRLKKCFPGFIYMPFSANTSVICIELHLFH